MIVNTASKCGLTPQYKDLEAIYIQRQGFVIVGFPANNFASQEPGTNEIASLPTITV
jgi:glutathione peroxidase